MKYKKTYFAEARLYIGSVKGYRGETFTEGAVTRAVQSFQKSWKEKHDWTVAVRITKTCFVCMDYNENGWEISGFNYPRFPRTEEELSDFFTELQEHLMLEFGQNRITVIFDFHGSSPAARRIVMAEREDAEESHK